ncbi:MULTISPECIES: TonB-dependent receptor domain-containing protein [unclassified Vibrio]|uniref:TonB-dependent receptor n=1 Tax=Vibrio sp. HB236076 TaxID=3232307 RepID=A0AB39HF44_9VIBR|nr:TonB-dependent receptor [Vibrio sp. HB161653]MDP5255755.1 TonB-dependent receptor [Vibrio sp. HB161653]
MKKTALALAMASLFPSINALADDDQDNVIVTATRFESKLNESLAPVEVITHKQIEDLQAQSLSEVLRRLPGIQVSNQGGSGQNISLFVRGRATKNVLVLINGVRIGSATTGAANLAAIPLHGVSRIEVLRGPRAAVYGSDAVSGVVNIITEQGKNGETNVTAGLGSYNHKRLSGSVALASDEQWLNMAATYQSEDGYNVVPDSTTDTDSDDDGYISKYFLTDFGKKLNDNWLLKVNGYYQKQYTEYDGFGFADKSDSDLYNLAVITQYQYERWQSHFSLSTNQDKLDSYGNNNSSLFQTNRYTAAWENQYQISEPLAFVGGIEWYRDDVKSSTEYVQEHRDNGSVYIGSYLNPGDFSLDSNFRFDHNSAYGSFGTYQFAAGYFITNDIRLIASYGTSFKAPTYNDLYYPLSFGYQGNPDLDPEKNKTAEIAIEGQFDLATVRLSTYRNDVEDMIATLSDFSTVENVDEAVIKGVELSSSFDTGPLSHQVSYDYLDTENKSTGEELARRARHSAKWNTAYNIKQWHFDVSYLYQGTRQDSEYNDVVLSPYSLVDFAMSYSFNNGVKLGGKVGNVFDEDYETASGYATPERNYYGSISYTF